jgi:hypothetical protein
VGTGAVRWVQRFDDSIHGEDHPRGIAIDDSGSVYVTGFASDSAVVQAAITIKYNRGGDQLWVDRFVVDSLERYEQNEGWQVALDKQYHPIVGLTEYRQSLRSMLVKYNPDGTIQWRQMVLDGGDNAFAVGYSTGNRPVVTRFTNLGVQSWAFVDSSVTGSDYLDAHLDHSGKMYLSLDGQSVGTDRDFVVVKYSQGPDGVRKAPGVLPTTFRLHNAYPNPFNPRTRIEYALPSRQPVVLKVFNLLGEEVSTLVNEVQEPGDRYADFNAAGLASGVYFYRLQAGPFTGVRKVLLMK